MVPMSILTPPDFRFEQTVTSHGWYQLAPFQYDEASKTLSRPHRLSDGRLVTLRLRGTKTAARSIAVEVDGVAVLTSGQRNTITTMIRHMFRLSQNLTPFYEKMAKDEAYQWVAEHKVARLLASPTVWEDLVKTLFTTNTAWSNTRQMVAGLVSLDAVGLFPSPQQVADHSLEEIENATKAGYRAEHLHDLARRITVGEIDVERWRTLSSDDLFKAITDLQGFGDYAAGNVLRLLGHYDKLAIDSVARTAFEHITGKAPESDTEIRDYYERFGDWRGLVLWMDCIREEYVAEQAPDETPLDSAGEAQPAAG